MICVFCGGWCNEIYKMGGYGIVQCAKCKTSAVKNPPTENILADFYQGFLFQANKENLSLYDRIDMRNYLSSFNLGKNAQMLDVGGGGGFMAKIFEQNGFGDGHYVDLDKHACEFANRELDIKNVYHENINTLPCEMSSSFDFIYSRHVIEHVLNPVQMIEKMIDLLRDGGVIEMILPNGSSMEYVGYPAMLENRINKIMLSNKGWTRNKVWKAFLSGKIAHGIDPIRHLWAITGRGIDALLAKRENVTCGIKTAPLSDPVYSMYFAAVLAENCKKKMLANIINHTFTRIAGSCHLVVTIRKTGKIHGAI